MDIAAIFTRKAVGLSTAFYSRYVHLLRSAGFVITDRLFPPYFQSSKWIPSSIYIPICQKVMSDLKNKDSLHAMLQLRNKLFHENINAGNAIYDSASAIYTKSRHRHKETSMLCFGRAVLLDFWKFIKVRVCNEDHAELVRLSCANDHVIVGLKITLMNIASSDVVRTRLRENTYLNPFNILQSEVFRFLQTVGQSLIAFSFNLKDEGDDALPNLYLCLKIGSSLLEFDSIKIDERLRDTICHSGFAL